MSSFCPACPEYPETPRSGQHPVLWGIRMRWKGKHVFHRAIGAALNTDSHEMNRGFFWFCFPFSGIWFPFLERKINPKKKVACETVSVEWSGLPVGSCTLSETQASRLSWLPKLSLQIMPRETVPKLVLPMWICMALADCFTHLKHLCIRTAVRKAVVCRKQFC